ncbi:velvet factor-domain-containing protein [Mycena epipterygia]|nr:velvet factor-domain-containing protein [Mycena epipterygia]
MAFLSFEDHSQFPTSYQTSPQAPYFKQPTFPAERTSPSTFMRAQLVEIQTAEVGRKCGTVDRRPLDPPPVVMLQLFLVTNAGTPMIEPLIFLLNSSVDSTGFICEAELFPLDRVLSTGYNPCSFHEPAHPSSSVASTSHQQHVPLNCTGSLTGSTFVQASTIEHEGKKCLMFAFTDLSSRLAGDLVLRYKFFNIFSRPDGLRSGALEAECWGHQFHVYSTKDVPSLKPSTDLTRSLAKAGIPVKLRSKERGCKKKSCSYASDELE